MSVPALGPRGEGWVAAQLVLFAAIAVAGLGSVASSPGGPMPTALAFGALVTVAGLLVVVRGAADLGSNLTPFPRPRAVATLIDGGTYRYVRHPIYSGLVLAAVGWSSSTVSPLALLLAATLALLFDAKSRREEAWLTEKLPGYAAYQARTRRFVPGIY